MKKEALSTAKLSLKKIEITKLNELNQIKGGNGNGNGNGSGNATAHGTISGICSSFVICGWQDEY